MEDKDFNALAGTAMTRIESALEAVDAEIDFELAAGGVLEIEFEDGSKIIVNRHAVAKEIWVAARAGCPAGRRPLQPAGWRDRGLALT